MASTSPITANAASALFLVVNQLDIVSIHVEILRSCEVSSQLLDLGTLIWMYQNGVATMDSVKTPASLLLLAT